MIIFSCTYRLIVIILLNYFFLLTSSFCACKTLREMRENKSALYFQSFDPISSLIFLDDLTGRPVIIKVMFVRLW